MPSGSVERTPLQIADQKCRSCVLKEPEDQDRIRVKFVKLYIFDSCFGQQWEQVLSESRHTMNSHDKHQPLTKIRLQIESSLERQKNKGEPRLATLLNVGNKPLIFVGSSTHRQKRKRVELCVERKNEMVLNMMMNP